MFKPKPFVKWAGGKKQIVDELKKHIPDNYNYYFEPFIGGGALFFELMPKKAKINDYNLELMNIYSVLADYDKYIKMCRRLNYYEKKNSQEFYYYIRSKDKNKRSINKMRDWSRAARIIYLNKACFNGLYRVNSKNEFNVPYNKKTKINTYEAANLLAVHMFLKNSNINISYGDFEEAVEDAKKSDFVYFDPPYDTLKDSFTTYTELGFGKEEQIRLSKVFKSLDKKGVKVMLSNSNTPLIQELYKEYNISIISAKRNINSNGNGRGNVEELIITNY